MRGKAQADYEQSTAERITPAYAGKSSGSWCQPLSDRDHPRLCGEKSDQRLSRFCSWGSPPPMRGKAEREPTKSGVVGITPAYAGKSR